MDSIQFGLPWVKPVLTTSFNRNSRASCFDIQHSINIRVTCWVYRAKSETVGHVISASLISMQIARSWEPKNPAHAVFQNSSRTTSLRGFVGGCWRMESQVFFLKPCGLSGLSGLHALRPRGLPGTVWPRFKAAQTGELESSGTHQQRKYQSDSNSLPMAESCFLYLTCLYMLRSMGSQIQCPLWSNHCHSESISRPYFVQNAEEFFFELIRTFYIQNSQAPCYCGAFQVWCNPLLDYIAYRHMNRLTIGSDCPVGLWIGSSGPSVAITLAAALRRGFSLWWCLLIAKLLSQTFTAGWVFRTLLRPAELFIHCCEVNAFEEPWFQFLRRYATWTDLHPKTFGCMDAARMASLQ